MKKKTDVLADKMFEAQYEFLDVASEYYALAGQLHQDRDIREKTIQLGDAMREAFERYEEAEYALMKAEEDDLPDNAATIARIDPNKGYVPGNVRIVSMKAYRMLNLD